MSKNQQKIHLFEPTEEHRLLRETVKGFAAKEVAPQAEKYDKEEKFNLPLFQALGELGLFGLTIDAAYGGSEMDALSAVIAHEELSAEDPGLTLAYLAHAILCANNLFINGNEEQKKRFLPDLCSGKKVGAMAMSEPHVGTDVLNMKTTCELKNGKYILNGRKMWITNGQVDEEGTMADCVLLYAVGKDKKLSSFLVEKDFKGASVGQKIYGKTGMRSSNTVELVFENCEVPKENLIGEEGGALSHMMRNLEIERVTLAAISTGIAKKSLQLMLRYANEREAFQKKLSKFGQIQKYIADSYSQYMSARFYLYHTAYHLDLHKSDQRVDSDGVKLLAATMAKDVADHAMQVMGGYGYVSEYIVERLWRDAKLIEIGGGTLEAHQKNIMNDLSKNPQFLDKF